MSQKEPEVTEPRQAGPSQPIRNPYILNFCKVLVERKSEKVEGEALKKLSTTCIACSSACSDRT